MAHRKKISLKPKFVSSHRPLALAWGSGLLIVIGLVAWFQYYEQRIWPGVRIGSISVGGLTRDQAAERLRETLTDRGVTLTYSQRHWEPRYSDLGIVYDLTPAISQAYSLGRWASLGEWARTWLGGQSVPLSYTWTSDDLDRYLAKVLNEIGPAPKQPQVTFVNNGFQVTPPESGLVIDTDQLQAQLHPAVSLGQNSSLALQPALEWPTVTAEDFTAAMSEAEAFLAEPLELRDGEQVFMLSQDERAGWFAFSARAEGRVDVAMDESLIGAYLLSLAKQINQEPQAQEVIASKNKVEEIRPGTPGRALAIAGAVSRIVAASLSFGTTTVDLPVNDVPPNTAYATAPAPPIATGKVITVDLTKQHEYVYQDGVLVFSSKISSGMHDWTPTGSFRVYAKTKKQKMSGPDYYVPNVPDILWFKGDYSIHGVYWHNDFGIRPRSHGCVGMPLDAAAWLFDWAEVGTPVVIYKS